MCLLLLRNSLRPKYKTYKFSQKLKPTKFDQIFTEKISTSTILNRHIEKIYFLVNLLILINLALWMFIFLHINLVKLKICWLLTNISDVWAHFFWQRAEMICASSRAWLTSSLPTRYRCFCFPANKKYFFLLFLM